MVRCLALAACTLLFHISLLRNDATGQLIENAGSSANKYSLVSICDSLFSPNKFGIDPEGLNKTGICTELIADAATLSRIKSAGFHYQTAISDLSDFYASRAAASNISSIAENAGFRLGSMGGYLTLDEIYAEFSRLRAKFPAAVSEARQIGLSVERRPVYAWRISLAPEADSVPETMLTALHHAREPGSVMALLYFLWNYLPNGIEANSSHEAAFLLRRRAIWCIPAINPDGYEYNRATNPNGGGLWRKNRRKTDGYFGVDLNRNYGPPEFWDAPNGGSSINPHDDTYRGSAPFSEPEIQALRDFIQAHNFKIALNYHTYGNVYIYPFSYVAHETNDSALFRHFGAEITRKSCFSLGRDIETLGYGIRGGSDDYFYSAGNILSLTPESGSQSDGFWARPDRIEMLAADNLYSIYQSVWSAGVNLRPIEFQIHWTSDTAFTVQIIVMNVGTQQHASGQSITCFSPIDKIIIYNQLQTVKQLNPAESDTIRWKGTISRHDGNEISSTLSLTIDQQGAQHTDSIQIFARRPDVINLFADSADISQWNTQNWGVRHDADGISLASSPIGYYRPNTVNIAEFNRKIDLRKAGKAEINFEATWNFAFKKDVGTIEVSTTSGRSWVRLGCSRMRQDVALPDTIGGGFGFAYSGNFPLWERQQCSLDAYCGKEILLRFVMAAEPGYPAKGIAFRNVKIERYYTGMPAWTIDTAHLQSDVFPSPSSSLCYASFFLTKGQIPAGTPIEIDVFSSLGQNIFHAIVEANGENETIIELPATFWPSGAYFMSATCNNYTIRKKLTILH